jgi:hypothetical protein
MRSKVITDDKKKEKRDARDVQDHLLGYIFLSDPESVTIPETHTSLLHQLVCVMPLR